MTRRNLVLTALLLVLFAGNALAQGGNAQLGGIVQDPGKALIPGVTVTAINVDTNVTITTLTNESGAYNFPVLLPGTYKVSAELTGFKKGVYENFKLGYAAQSRLDFSLTVGTTAQTVEVTATAEAGLRESSASVGDVLTTEKIGTLPMVGNNVLSLLDTLPGLRLSPTGDAGNTIGGLTMDAINVTRDGLSINDTRYSSTVYGTNTFTSTTLLPDLVGEIRLIISPVDAELGRGNSQVQIMTRSGTNKYTGAASWNIQNTALNANSWTNNHTIVNGQPTPLSWNNNNQYTVSYGGPVSIPGLYNGKDKTFFYALWNQNIHDTRANVTSNVLTPTARLGIFRYFTGWNPIGWNTTSTGVVSPAFPLTATAQAQATAVAVDLNGNPVAPKFNYDGSPYTGHLACFSVFGNQRLDTTGAMVPFTPGDCSGGTIATPSSGNAWDPLRTTADTTGYQKMILGRTPLPNYFGGGDGLNIAQYQFQQHRNGSNSLNAEVGADLNVNTKQINLKIDQNFTSKHRLAVSWSYQHDDSDANLAGYPDGISGSITRRPYVLTANMTSTLGASLVNEARFGVNRNSELTLPAWFSTDTSVKKAAEELLMPGGASVQNPNYIYKTIIGNGVGNILNSGGPMLTGAGGSIFGAAYPIAIDALWSYGDTISWTHGKHAFKFGGEIRLPRTNGNGNTQPYPSVAYGNNASSATTAGVFCTSGLGTAASPCPTTNFTTELPGLLGQAPTGTPTGTTSARANVNNLLYWMNGSVATVLQSYWIEGYNNVATGAWDDASTVGDRYRNQIFFQSNAFAKDDYKVTRRLTLNLGVRWEYYDSPYLESGLTTAINGYGYGMWGPARTAAQSAEQFNADPFNIFMKPGNIFLTGYGSSTANPLSCTNGVQQNASLPVSTCDPNQLSSVLFVGPKSPNPGKTVIPTSKLNIGPAIGFAYQLPWFGEGKTTVRGGYQVTYGQAGINAQAGGTDTLLGSAPGAFLTPTTVASDYSSILATRALNLTDIPALVPVRPTSAPGATVQIYGRSVTFQAYDPNYKTPYTQNLTLSVTRSVTRNITVDLRYIGTLARKLDGSVNLNTPNVYHNPELLQALNDARAGQDPVLLDQLLAGLNLNNTVTGFAPVGTKNSSGVYQTGAAQLRRNATFATNLANGDFNGIANSLITLALTAAQGVQVLPNDPSTGVALTGVSSMRALRNGCDRLANGAQYVQQTTGGTFTSGFNASNATPLRCFPEDYLIANPQFSTATYNGNLGHSNYNSFQAQITARPIQGVSIQSTYIWAKSMQLATNVTGFAFSDPSNRDLDFARGREGPHSIRMNGTIELPIGPNKLLMPNSSGWVARAVERWQTSFIFNGSTGSPADALASVNHLYGNSNYDVVNPQWKIPKGEMQWNGPNNQSGTFYGNTFINTLDPQCSTTSVVATTDTMGTNLAASCTLNALALSNSDGTAGPIMLAYPMPGTKGNLGPRTLSYFGQWSLDASASKTIRVSESKSLQIRIDALNVFNHPVPGTPNYTVGGTNFGAVTTKTGQRTFQGQLRVSF